MKFNWLYAQFADRQLEKEFLEYERANSVKYMRPLILALGILFFLFIIPDYFLNPTERVFRTIFLFRGIFLVLVVSLYILLAREEIQRNLFNWVSAYAFIVSFFYLYIYHLYETFMESYPFFVQSLAVIALILIFFSLDSHWLYMVGNSLFLCAGFLIVSHYFRREAIPMQGFAAVSVYTLIVLIISSISAYRINIYKRMQFLDRRELEHLSEEDALTRVYNRKKFDAELDRWLELAKRYNHGFSIIIIDIDDLKAINDLYGHLSGDLVLKEMAGLVQGQLRSSDVFARWGGDEFIILLPDTDLQKAVRNAERIRDTIVNRKFSHGQKVSCSFGVAAFEEGDDRIKIIQRADSRLYKAKNTGKSQIISEG